MILQPLVSYYEILAKENRVPIPGRGNIKISYAININKDGEIVSVLPLKTTEKKGKKEVMVPREMLMPKKDGAKTSGIKADFLWGNCEYMLGTAKANIDESAKTSPRSIECFEAAKKMHLSLLFDIKKPIAEAICNFFKNGVKDEWQTEKQFRDIADDIKGGANMCFFFEGEFPQDTKEIAEAWQKKYDGYDDGDGASKMRCLVMGELLVPARTHNFIKGVAGAKSSGAALISFNETAYCSFNKKQNNNAPVGKYAAFAYTAALNYLLSQRDGEGRPRFSKRIGDTTMVYWAETGEEKYQDVFSAILDGSKSDEISDRKLNSIMDAISRGKPIDWSDISLSSSNKFYILGISPNAARLSVRFFFQSTFGNIVSNLEKHYQRLNIVKPSFDNFEMLPLWKLMDETVNSKSKDKAPSPQLTGDTLRAIISGGRYPTTLYKKIQLRIRAERNVTRGRAAIIKAFLMRNITDERYKEVLTVELNENTRYQPYVLGRLFSVLEEIQQKANPDIKTTIKAKYFTSACTTPAVVFPTLLNLAEKHLKKIDGNFFSIKLCTLMGFVTESYPSHHMLDEQGIFQLGYYHQTQKRYEKKISEVKGTEE